MLTSKERAYLRSLSNKIDSTFQIGKGGVNDNQLKQIAEALEKRELVKVHVLENSWLDTRAVCNEVADSLSAEPVQAIGKKFVIYKESKEFKEIDLKDAYLSDTERLRKKMAKLNEKKTPKKAKQSAKQNKEKKPFKKTEKKTFKLRRSK